MDKIGYDGCVYGPSRLWLATLPGHDCAKFHIIPCVLRSNVGIVQVFADRGITLRNLQKGKFDPTTLIGLCRLIRQERIRLLHLHGDGATTFGRLAGWITGVPAIVHYHDTADRLPWYVHWVDRLLGPRTAKAVAISDSVAEACRRVRHLKPEQITVIPNGIEEDWFSPADSAELARIRSSFGIRARARVIGSVTRFRWEKDVPTFIQALADPLLSDVDCHAVIVGEGPEKALIEQKIHALGLQARVHLAGYQPNVRPFLAAMEVVVFSSVTEGFGLALLEAMGMRRPVVVTAIGGMRELVQHEQNGLVVPARDSKAMALAIRRLLDDPTLAQRLAAAAGSATQNFSRSKHVCAIEKLYEDVLHG